MRSNVLRAVIMGAPGSGKGTIAKRIVDDFNLKFLSSGDVLRNEILLKSPIGIKCERYLKHGALVPDDIMEGLILNKINKMKDQSWLLDGFPRDLAQAAQLETSKLMPDVVIELVVPFDVILERVKARWIHESSGRVYNTDYKPPKVPGKDDLTGEPLIQRIDDQPETVMARLQSYKRQTIPVSDFFREKGLLIEFKGRESDEIWPRVRKHLLTLRPLNK